MNYRNFAIALVAIGSLVVLNACKNDTSDSSTKGEKTQEQNMQRAQQALPVPEVKNFTTRKAVNKWIERNDQKNKTYYIYILGDNGNYLRYHTASTRPISTCTFVTPPDRVEKYDAHNGWNPIVRTAPAMDGVYYKGGDCSVFFFTADTDAFVQIPNGVDYITYGQPLSLDVQEVKVGLSKQDD